MDRNKKYCTVVLVRVILSGLGLVGLLDLVVGGVLVDAHDLVQVLRMFCELSLVSGNPDSQSPVENEC